MSEADDRPSRGRGIAAAIAVGLGALLVTLALLLAFVVVPIQTKTPLDIDGRVVSTGTGDVLDAASMSGPKLVTDHNVPILYRQEARIVEPSDAKKLTVELGTAILRTDQPEDTGLVSATVERFTVGRVSAMAVEDGDNGSIARDQGQPAKPIRVDGLQLKWPMNAKPQTYPFYDSTELQSNPIDYVDTTTVRGLKAYHYHQTLAPFDLSKVDPSNGMDLPAGQLGLSGVGNIHVRMFYTCDRDYYVEPKTGTVLNAVERINQYLGRTANEQLVTAFKYDAQVNDATIDEQVAQARKGLDKIHLAGVYLPIAFGVLGAVLVAGGLAVGLRGQRKTTPDSEKLQ